MRLPLTLIFLSTFLPLAAASDGFAGNNEAAAVNTAGYESRAGAILGTWRPARPAYTPESMARAAKRFLLMLNDAQRRAAHYDLKSPERTRWTNAPDRGEVGGIALGDLDGAQLRAFSDLLAAVLSEKGYYKIRDVMLGDDLRAVIGGKPNPGVGIEAFRFAVFGDPSATSRWAVQLDGHHVALNITLDGEAWYMSPSFIGTFPQGFSVAGAKLRPLGAETDLAFYFVNSLTPEQRALAVIGERRGAMRAGAGRDGVRPEPLGMRCDALDEAQREKLLALASQWFELMPPRHARARRERFSEAIGETWFSWSGPLAAGSDVSWVIQGPSVIMEYANDARGGGSGGNAADHVHTIYRDINREYGGGFISRPRSDR
ncbi:MAG: DUF3500 domain-containing protein [Nitrospinae bacterium]|nr:DUF3500 domain-containing protein [Nitrospinota bacterium]